MAFYTSFDGFVVIHAPFACPERRAHFEKEFPRVGIESFSVLEAKQVSEQDSRLKYYATPRPSVLSLIDGFLDAIDRADNSGWSSVVILEDDVAFRGDFDKQWAGVEEEVRTTDWAILTLHRLPTDGTWLTPEPVFSRTRLVPIFHNTGTYCVIVRRRFYAAFRDSLRTCIERGYPCDFFYGIFSSVNTTPIFATNRNLTGQAKGLTSTIAVNTVRDGSVYSRFRGAPSPLSTALNFAHLLNHRAKKMMK